MFEMQKISSLLPLDKIVTAQVIRFSSNLIPVLVHPALGIICFVAAYLRVEAALNVN